MKSLKIIFLLFCLMMVASCAQYKRLQTRDNTERNRITNAILDYIYTEKEFLDTYSCFSIISSSDTNEVIIEGSLNKFDILISPIDSSAIPFFSSENDAAYYIDKETGDTIISIMNYSSHPLIWADSKQIKVNYDDLPSELFQYEKVFYRYDRTKSVSKEILDILYSYDVIDTIVLQLLPVHPETIIDDNPISVVYTFNNKNIKKYKKYYHNTRLRRKNSAYFRFRKRKY